jgi:hypothetical protein
MLLRIATADILAVEDFIEEYKMAFVFVLWGDDKINPCRLS